MENTSNKICRCLALLLENHGVRRAVVSPGSRNAPLLIAFSRRKDISLDVVADERSAAFIALGYALISREPVALVCTSGTALLNYGPAVAEAFYRKVPLIVVSADRPHEWIGQDDSQTIVQPGALSNYVKRSYNLPVGQGVNDIWYANRVINDAMIAALTGRCGPVHINVQLDDPLGELSSDMDDDDDMALSRKIKIIRPDTQISTQRARALGRSLASPVKVMVVAGFLPPDKTLNKALNRLAALPNFVVLTETISNLHGSRFIGNIDSALSTIRDDQESELVPDVVISLGGAIVSRHIKQFLRRHKIKEHWHVGETEDTVDCFRQLTKRIEIAPEVFFPQLASAMQPHRAECDYAVRWETLRNRADSLTQAYSCNAPWSDLKAFATLIPMIPRRWNVQYSNGTSIRYAQIFGNHEYHRCDCNRGVSGIDGCTSTAIGASMAYAPETTLLVTGDMSFRYDISALVSEQLSPNFKMVIIDNGGGGIFRFIASTSSLDVRERLFCNPKDLNYKDLFKSFGFEFFDAYDETNLRHEFKKFITTDFAPAALVIHTPAELSAEVLKDYFTFCKLH